MRQIPAVAHEYTRTKFWKEKDSQHGDIPDRVKRKSAGNLVLFEAHPSNDLSTDPKDGEREEEESAMLRAC